MTRSAKIVISVVIVIITGVGYMILSGQSNNNNASQQRNPSFSNHMNRILHQTGILPGGDGGGG